MKKRDTKESVLSKLDELSGSQGELLSVSCTDHMLESCFHPAFLVPFEAEKLLMNHQSLDIFIDL